jgi:uncharacterized protein YndB with AHSA1/START domain
VTSRLIDAPRELVFEAWTRPEHVDQWMGPSGFTTVTREMDVRPGGVWRFVMRHAEYGEFNERVVYIEVVKPERLVYSHGSDTDDDAGRFHVTTTFEAQGGKTLLTMRAVLASAAERDRAVNEFNAVEGGKQTVEKLVAHLQRMQSQLGERVAAGGARNE